jgi:hypothetical protein
MMKDILKLLNSRKLAVYVLLALLVLLVASTVLPGEDTSASSPNLLRPGEGHYLEASSGRGVVVEGYSRYYPAFPEREVAAMAKRLKEGVV